LFGKMFFAEPGQFFLTIVYLLFDEVKCFLQLSEND
jgi:hypothetical protein